MHVHVCVMWLGLLGADVPDSSVRTFERLALIAILFGFLCGYTVFYSRYSSGRPEVFSDLVQLSEALDRQVERIRKEDLQQVLQFTLSEVRRTLPLSPQQQQQQQPELETLLAAQLVLFWEQFPIMFPQEDPLVGQSFRERLHEVTMEALPQQQEKAPLQEVLQKVYDAQDALIRSQYN